MGRILLFILLLLWPAFSFAQDEKDTFFALKFIRKDAATSSSKCIGKPTTPECALDTYNACQIWWDNNLCRTVQDEDLLDKHLTKHGLYHDLGMLAYQATNYVVLKSSDIPAKNPDRFYFGDVSKWKAGDRLIVNREEWCEPDNDCYDKYFKKGSDKLALKCPPVDCSDPYPDRPELHFYGFILREIKPGKWNVIDSFQPVTEILENISKSGAAK